MNCQFKSMCDIYIISCDQDEVWKYCRVYSKMQELVEEQKAIREFERQELNQGDVGLLLAMQNKWGEEGLKALEGKV